MNSTDNPEPQTSTNLPCIHIKQNSEPALQPVSHALQFPAPPLLPAQPKMASGLGSKENGCVGLRV